jgi:hypothetical protein
VTLRARAVKCAAPAWGDNILAVCVCKSESIEGSSRSSEFSVRVVIKKRCELEKEYAVSACQAILEKGY